MSFVNRVLQHTKDYESPRRYFYWSALASIAAVVKDNVYLDRDQSKLYPNIFVLLVGRSGLRKGPPVNLAKEMVAAVNNTKLYAGRVSIQGVIADLSKAKTSPNGGPPNTGSAGVLFASEFSSFIIKDSDALTILTDLYDRHYYEKAGWNYLLRNSPVETLEKPVLTMLGASNQIHLMDALPKNSIGGGFVARTFIVYADKKASVNSLMKKHVHARGENPIPRAALITELATIAKCKGEMLMDDESQDYYDAWYKKLQDVIEQEGDETGTLERLHDHVLKATMLIALSNRHDMTINVNDVKEAITACQSFVPAARKISLMNVGAAKNAPGTAVLLGALLNEPTHSITRTLALQKFWQHFSAPELDAIVADLDAQKAITVRADRDARGRPEVRYTLNEEVVRRYEDKIKKGKKDDKSTE